MLSSLEFRQGGRASPKRNGGAGDHLALTGSARSATAHTTKRRERQRDDRNLLPSPSRDGISATAERTQLSASAHSAPHPHGLTSLRLGHGKRRASRGQGPAS